MRKATTFCGIFVVALGALLANSSIWLWTIFSLDYFLGNPSPLRDYRNELFQREYDNYPVKGYVKPQSFQEINASDYTFGGFEVLTNHWRLPVIIRGLFKETPMLKWTPQYLADHFRQHNRTFLVVKKNDFNAKEATAFVHLDSEWMPLDQMINNISAGGTNYLQNANLFFPQDMPLYEEMELKRTGFDRITFLVQFFLGRKLPGEVRGSGSSLHCAAAPNLFIQIRSQKHWIMFHPKWSRYVMPNMFNYQVAAGSMAGLLHQNKEKNRWGNFPRWEGTLQPGDALWVPGWFWHEVHNIPNDDWSIAAATRYSTFFQLWENNPLFTFLADWGTREKPCLPGTRFICAALHPGVEKGSLMQTHSGAAQEAVVRRLLKQGVLEKDAE
jgi:hypothetical protein